MGLIKKYLFLSGILLAAHGSFSQQVSPAVQRLQDYCKSTAPVGYSPRLKLLTLTPRDNLHYLFPFYNGFRDEQKFRQIYTSKGYDAEMSEYFAFAGDYETALEYLVKSYDTVSEPAIRKVYRTAEGLNNIQHVSANLYIHLLAKTQRVIMIDEAYSKPIHRAFTMSLLADLYRQGFRYLAMEMLNNFSNHDLSRVTMHTGYYSSEPVAGELIRSALALGYTLVSYEDTAAATHTPNQRDSIQAMNIYSVLQKDTAAKILVHASFAQISEKVTPDGTVPMALAFKRISGIDPLTIDQTDMTEESNFAYGRTIYQAYLQKFQISAPSIALVNNVPVNVTDKDLYDLCVIHPPTIYKAGRPDWLSLGGTRQPTGVKPPSPGTYFVQAYYLSEIEKNDNTPWQLIPADQTYITNGKNSYQLYLKKGKYKIFFRDINYQILNTLIIEVG